MPMHSSKNYYKAEQAYQDYHDHQDWIHIKNDWHWYYHNEEYCCCGREYRCKCGYRYSSSVSYYARPFECGAYSVCDFCYDYHTTHDKIRLLESYYTHQQILETLQTHLQDTNCWCYERVRTHILRRRVDTLLRPRRCSSVVFIPTEYRADIMTECVVKILDKRLGNEVKSLHDIKVHNEKTHLLEKYGLTLEDYTKFRMERPDICEPIEPPKPLPPKQKFVKVKESMLQEGEF